MKRYLLAISLILTVATQAAVKYNWQSTAVKYNGQTVATCSDYVRTQCGTTQKSVTKEVSGLACSRVTPGYLWCIGDEGYQYVYAISPTDGSLKTKLKLSNPSDMSNRDDWEDICTGTYNGTKYIFVGAFGDNDLQYADQYYIVCIPEPALTSSSASAKGTIIKFGFPDSAAHNVETLMYDSVTQYFYIVNKIKDAVAQIFKLPMSLNYGTSLQRLTAGPMLGQESDGWDFITAGDISPDGSLVAIKNKKQLFLWSRQGQEDIFQTVQRAPQSVGTYQKEDQGESVAWLDNYTFYTTSDGNEDEPIYKYYKSAPTGLGDVESQESGVRKVFRNGRLYIQRDGVTYDAAGRAVK